MTAHQYNIKYLNINKLFVINIVFFIFLCLRNLHGYKTRLCKCYQLKIQGYRDETEKKM